MAFDTNQDSHKAFRDIASERTKSVVVWIGAGLSKPAGCPLWTELRDELIDVGFRKANHFTVESQKKGLEKKCEVARTLPLWNAFGLLRDALGKTSYTETIKRMLSPAETAVVPSIYSKIWELRPSGILNLNLDRLASRAHSEVQGGRGINECVGRQISGNFGLLKATLPFVVYLHGTANDARSWVMTEADLNNLMTTAGYKDFIKACFASRTVLFVGMSADDVAAGGHLQAMTKNGIDAGQHFWLTNRADHKTEKWAERAGIRTIQYNALGNDHSEMGQFFDDVLNYLPQEQFAPPVKLASAAGAPIVDLPEPEELIRHPDSDEIRKVLNREATEILREPTQNAYRRFDEFSSKYDQAIWRAWYISTLPPSNKLLGFTITKEIAKGAFGKVYLATREGSSDELAIKVLHHDIRRDPQLLQSFRRGVRSMEILSTSAIEGMIPYKEASEIPAFAVMEFIPGPNLSQAVKAGDISSWTDVLRISCDLAHIIEAAHQLPERVLHRDIRPANVMLRGFHRNATDYEVLVLDFDLSWHRGASELSVMAPQAVSGFLAPEQVHRDDAVSTRHAAVDSFGLGMTLYFLRSGQEPVFSQHMHGDWQKVLNANVTSARCSNWKSLPRRFSRLVEASTRHKQSERWDMSQIVSELDRLKDAEASPQKVRSAELFAEELAQLSDMQNGYEWDSDQNQAVRDAHGNHYVIRGLEAVGQVQVELSWTSAGGANVNKYLRGGAERAVAELKRGRWNTVPPDISASVARVVARIPVGTLQRDLQAAADSLSAAMSAFNIH